MKSDLSRNKWKAYAALLLCAGLIAGHPLVMRAESNGQSVQTVQQQQIRVKGTVNDTMGPIIGASVVEKGNISNGTITDIDGNFVLSVKPDAILVISYIGYQSQEIQAVPGKVISIVLKEDSEMLDEVVVVGYGTAKKSDLTGSVVRADIKALENSPSVNIFQGLKGVVPGLNIGTSTTAGGNPEISIRGRNSISGTTGPLIVLDGIIYRGEITDINPSDIESIDVLKDVSSAAIYGSQAANGVLMITTKNAKGMSKPIIEYSGSFSFQSLINHDLKRLDKDGFLNQLADLKIGESRMGDDLLQRNPNFDPTLSFRDENIAGGYLNGTNVDWEGLLTESVPYIQNHSLSVRGKGDLSSYFLSFGFTDQKNLVVNDTYKRYNIRVNLDTEITKWLKVGTQSFFTLSDFSGVAPSFSNVIGMPVFVSPYKEDGKTLKEQNYMGNVNPLLAIQNPNTDKRYLLNGTFYADVKLPVKGLSYRVNYSNAMTFYRNYKFEPYANSQLGQGYKKNSHQSEWTLDHILTYKNDFGKHSVNATFVYGVEKRSYETTTATGYNFTNKSLGYDYMEAAQSDLNKITSEAWEEASLYNMLRLGYTFDGKYMFTGTIRRDGFSGFGKNNKFGYFPTAAIAWRINEESFLKDKQNWIDNLKLRLSYGMSGNRTTGRYSTMAHMSTKLPFSTSGSESPGGYVFGDGATGQLTQVVSKMSNLDLSWETTTAFNVGVDFSVLNARLFGNFEFYVSNTKDLLYDINIPNMNGMFSSTVPTNIGKLKNVGYEFSITGVPVRTKDFEWSVTGNFSLNKNKVVSILGIDADGDGREDDLVSSKIFMNKPYGVVYDYNIIGMWQVEDYNKGIIPSGFTYGTYKIEDIDKDGKYTADMDRKILGYTDPLYRFSIQNDFKYKNFNLKVFINAVQGGSDHYLGQPASGIPTPDNLSTWSFYKFDYWTPENPDAKYRQLGTYTEALGAGFSPYVSRSFIRLQELSLSYNLPQDWLKKIFISRAKVYISATNLFTITSWDGWDPEIGMGLTYNTNYPTQKNYTIGVNFEF